MGLEEQQQRVMGEVLSMNLREHLVPEEVESGMQTRQVNYFLEISREWEGQSIKESKKEILLGSAILNEHDLQRNDLGNSRYCGVVRELNLFILQQQQRGYHCLVNCSRALSFSPEDIVVPASAYPYPYH